MWNGIMSNGPVASNALLLGRFELGNACPRGMK